MMKQDGCPQEARLFKYRESPLDDGRPQGQCRVNKEQRVWVFTIQGGCPQEKDGCPIIRDGRPQGGNGRVMVEDGRPQGASREKNEYGRVMVGEGARPQGASHGKKEYPRIIVGEDGRPQGAPPRTRSTPVPTIYVRNGHRGIVGTGVERVRGGAPCGRPSSTSVKWKENGKAPCGRPSSTSVKWKENGKAPCGRPSSTSVKWKENGKAPCGRPSSTSVKWKENGKSSCGRLPLVAFLLCIFVLSLSIVFVPFTAHAA